MTEHRVPMLGGALRRRTDPSRSSDPQVRRLVAALAELEVAPAPRADFRAELRAQLVAVTPRLVEEGEPRAAVATRPGRRAATEPDSSSRRTGFRLAKPLIAVTSVLAAFVLLLGGAVLISRGSLPGDTLYGLKRASEDTQYGLTGGSVAKGKLKLDFASRRIGEVASLLPRAGALAAGTGAIADDGQVNQQTASLVRSTLNSADGDVRTAARLLGSAAVRTQSVGPLSAITSWAPSQLTRMRAIVARIPADALHDRAASTLKLISAAQHRAATLSGELACSCLTTSGTDPLGPVPCRTGCTATTPRGTPTHPAVPSTRSGSGHRSATVPVIPGTSATSIPTGGNPTGSAPAGHTSSAPSGATTTSPGIPIRTTAPTLPGLPSLPGPGSLPAGQSPSTPVVPITINSCGVQASLGPIHVGIGGC